KYAPGAKVSEISETPIPFALISSLVRGVVHARSVRPDLVLAGSGLMAPAAIATARISGAISAVYLHGLDVIAPSRLYQKCWLPCIRMCDIVVVNSRNTRRLAIEAGVDANLIRVVHPGADMPVFDRDARYRFRARHGVDATTPILLSVGRLTERKGLVDFVSKSLPTIRKAIPRVKLFIIGDQALGALHRGSGA